jgi:hypothetical protein
MTQGMEKRDLESDKGAKGTRLYRGVCLKPERRPPNQDLKGIDESEFEQATDCGETP